MSLYWYQLGPTSLPLSVHCFSIGRQGTQDSDLFLDFENLIRINHLEKKNYEVHAKALLSLLSKNKCSRDVYVSLDVR